jgi:hypothetical protein
LVAIVATYLMRMAIERDRRLREVESASAGLLEDYQNLMSSMPLGLVIMRNGMLTFSNGDWTSRLLDPDYVNEGTATSLPFAERDRVLRGLHQAELDRRAWSTLISASNEGSMRDIDVRAVPVYDSTGGYRHLLTFLVDVTELRRITTNLEIKNAEIETKNSLLQDALAQLEMNFESIVRALVRAVEAKDPYTAGHSERVMQYALWIAEELHLGPYERRLLEMGCLVHDIGKIGVPDNVLTKPGRLTDEEFKMIQMHPVYGAKIVENVELFQECLPIILWHHERLDGTGYPDQLQGDEIPFLVRISSVADVFDAMSSTRSYRVGMDLDKVFSIMDEDVKKGHFDPEVVTALKQAIAKRGIIPQGQFPDEINTNPAA